MFTIYFHGLSEGHYFATAALAIAYATKNHMTDYEVWTRGHGERVYSWQQR